MAKKSGNDDEFLRALKGRGEQLKGAGAANSPPSPEGTSGGTKMVLNKPPVVETKMTAEQLYEQEQQRERQQAEQSEQRQQAAKNSDQLIAQMQTLDHLREIPLQLIDDSPYQPRLHYDPMALDILGDSMRSAGQAELITVRPIGDRFQILGGHRRTRAARNIGWSTIKACVKQCDDHEAELLAMVQNQGREDLSAFEKARLLDRSIKGKFAATQEDAGKLLGIKQSYVSDLLKMLTLPEEILKILHAHPDVAGTKLSNDLHDLLKEHPGELELLVRGVERIVQGAASNTIKGWVKQMLQARKPRTKAVRSLVPDRAGNTLFSTKVDKNQVVISIEADIDAEVVQKWILSALRERAEKLQ
jgi:ParB/RepB/Spo0J family partition protein